MKRRAPAFGLLVLALFLARSTGAHAADTWTTPFAGVRRLERTLATPFQRIHAVVIDTCAAGVSFRATRPDEANRAVSSFGVLADAEVAINGDFFDGDEGFALGDGVTWPGRADRDFNGYIAFGASRAELIPHESLLTAPAPWITQMVGGRWTLISNGVARRAFNDGGFLCAPGLRHPRTAVGFVKGGRNVILAVADGRGAGGSVGVTCDEVIDFMESLGASDAMTLDGGGSSAMWIRGAGVINSPSGGAERVVRNHLSVRAKGAGAAASCNGTPTPPGKKRHVIDSVAFAAWRFAAQSDLAWVPEATITAHVTGPALPAIPRLVRRDDGRPETYVIDGLMRRWVRDATTFDAWRFIWANVEIIPAATVDAFLEGGWWPLAPYLVVGDGPAVYAIDPDAPQSSPSTSTPDGGAGDAGEAGDVGSAPGGGRTPPGSVVADRKGAESDHGCATAPIRRDRVVGGSLIVIVLGLTLAAVAQRRRRNARERGTQ